MKNVLLLCAALAILTGCSDHYWLDRGRDALDVVTLQMGYMGGAKARVGPLQAGLLADIGLVGIRGGEVLGEKDFWPADSAQPIKQDYVILLFGIEQFEGNRVCCLRGKSFCAEQAVLSIPINLEKDPERAQYAKDREIIYNPWPYLTEVEVCGGLLFNVRVGLNPGEFVDLLLGFAGVDIFDDDIGVPPPPAPDTPQRPTEVPADPFSQYETEGAQ